MQIGNQRLLSLPGECSSESPEPRAMTGQRKIEARRDVKGWVGGFCWALLLGFGSGCGWLLGALKLVLLDGFWVYWGGVRARLGSDTRGFGVKLVGSHVHQSRVAGVIDGRHVN